MLLDSVSLLGGCRIRQAISLPDDINDRFDLACERYTGRSLRLGHNGPPLQCGIESDPALLDAVLANGQLGHLIDTFFGRQVYFFGSDLSYFQGGSGFHRDVYTPFPVWKLAIYLDGAYGSDQTFHILPGSHVFDDRYSTSLGRHFAWPNGSGLSSSSGFEVVVDKHGQPETANIPTPSFQIERGDVVLFDQRTLHAVNSTTARRLIALTFVPTYELFVAVEGTDHGFTEDSYQETLIRFRAASILVARPAIDAYGPCSQSNFPELLQSELGPLSVFSAIQEHEFDEIIGAQFAHERKRAMPWLDGSAYRTRNIGPA